MGRIHRKTARRSALPVGAVLDEIGGVDAVCGGLVPGVSHRPLVDYSTPRPGSLSLVTPVTVRSLCARVTVRNHSGFRVYVEEASPRGKVSEEMGRIVEHSR